MRIAFASLSFVVAGSLAAQSPPRDTADRTIDHLGRLRPHASLDRAGAHVRPRRRHRRRPDRQAIWYVGVRRGRRVEDDERRHVVHAGLRRRGIVLDRHRHDRPAQPERRLGRHRREQRAARRRVRRRRLQVDRRRARAGRTWDSRSPSTSARIVIDPRNSDVVYVAAQGPLWSKGGDRGVYKTTDGGKTWTKILGVDDWTGANDIQLDPRNPDVLVATTWQRNRRVFAFIAGGPGSARLSLDRRAARPGTNRNPDSLMTTSGASASRCRRRIRASSTRSPRRRTTRAGSSARATAARAGSA